MYHRNKKKNSGHSECMLFSSFSTAKIVLYMIVVLRWCYICMFRTLQLEGTLIEELQYLFDYIYYDALFCLPGPFSSEYWEEPGDEA